MCDYDDDVDMVHELNESLGNLRVLRMRAHRLPEGEIEALYISKIIDRVEKVFDVLEKLEEFDG